MHSEQPVEWRKSSYCDSGMCVEVGRAGDLVAVRDSKNPDGAVLRFTKDEWNAFVAGVRGGEFEFI